MELLPSTPSFWMAAGMFPVRCRAERPASSAIAEPALCGSGGLPHYAEHCTRCKEHLPVILCSEARYDKNLSPPSGPSAVFDRKSLYWRIACIPIKAAAIK